jgi:hypothetical protein
VRPAAVAAPPWRPPPASERLGCGGAHLFVNTYLLGVTTFAAAGNSTHARYAAELAACESEHRVLGHTLAGASPPNDLGFAEFEFDRVSQIAAAAHSAGFRLR